ncbi:hypothetical protein [Helicobacter salomonis]|uniref:hypothetical protein n=1 Tax=Helicobacter salomonis TaxID=56878 RepID=UPI000CF18DCE|nr:hypothetical protein [Helicobacter salomonis]
MNWEEEDFTFEEETCTLEIEAEVYDALERIAYTRHCLDSLEDYLRKLACPHCGEGDENAPLCPNCTS